MRIIAILSAVVVATALGAYAVRRVDPIAAWLLGGVSAATALVLTGAFFGWIQI